MMATVALNGLNGSFDVFLVGKFKVCQIRVGKLKFKFRPIKYFVGVTSLYPADSKNWLLV